MQDPPLCGLIVLGHPVTLSFSPDWKAYLQHLSEAGAVLCGASLSQLREDPSVTASIVSFCEDSQQASEVITAMQQLADFPSQSAAAFPSESDSDQRRLFLIYLIQLDLLPPQRGLPLRSGNTVV